MGSPSRGWRCPPSLALSSRSLPTFPWAPKGTLALTPLGPDPLLSHGDPTSSFFPPLPWGKHRKAGDQWGARQALCPWPSWVTAAPPPRILLRQSMGSGQTGAGGPETLGSECFEGRPGEQTLGGQRGLWPGGLGVSRSKAVEEKLEHRSWLCR